MKLDYTPFFVDVTLSPMAGTDKEAWNRGTVFAKAQVLAREVLIFFISKLHLV